MLVTVFDGDNFEMLVTDCSATNIETDVIKSSPTNRCHQATSKLVTDVGDNFEMLVTILVFFVTDTPYLLILASVSKTCH